jgi:hypothetical protein
MIKNWLNGVPTTGSNVNDPGTMKYWENGTPYIHIYTTSSTSSIKVGSITWSSIKKINGIIVSFIKKIGGVQP